MSAEGTADFSLIAISDNAGHLDLDRISVGEHILLGGDNMDLALAYTLRAKLEADGKSISDMQFLALIHAASKAKVAMFEDESWPNCQSLFRHAGPNCLAEPSRRRLTARRLSRSFWTASSPRPESRICRRRRGGPDLQEFGLPYASDPVISKHLARFLTRSLENVKSSQTLSSLISDEARAKPFLAPTAVLFNGGVFKAASIRRRVLDLLADWNDGEPVRELAGYQPDLAVAKGASFYGCNRITGKGIRIKAGAARSYYIGLETSMPAVPGFKSASESAVRGSARDGGRDRSPDRRTGLCSRHRAACGIQVLLVGGERR